MARTFNVYKKDGTKILTEQASPVKITGLTADTQYALGDYLVSAVEEGKEESDKVEVPAFKTLVTPDPEA